MSRVWAFDPLESFVCNHTVEGSASVFEVVGSGDFGLAGAKSSRRRTTWPGLGEGVHWRMMPRREPSAWRFSTAAGAGPEAVNA